MGNSIKYPSIPQTAFWISEGKVEFFELEGLPVSGILKACGSKGGGGALMLQNILFFSLKKSLLHNIVQSIQNMVFLPTMPFNWYLLTMYEAPTVELGVTADPKGSITSWWK